VDHLADQGIVGRKVDRLGSLVAEDLAHRAADHDNKSPLGFFAYYQLADGAVVQDKARYQSFPAFVLKLKVGGQLPRFFQRMSEQVVVDADFLAPFLWKIDHQDAGALAAQVLSQVLQGFAHHFLGYHVGVEGEIDQPVFDGNAVPVGKEGDGAETRSFP
jgi:hypothetical protein